MNITKWTPFHSSNPIFDIETFFLLTVMPLTLTDWHVFLCFSFLLFFIHSVIASMMVKNKVNSIRSNGKRQCLQLHFFLSVSVNCEPYYFHLLKPICTQKAHSSYVLRRLQRWHSFIHSIDTSQNSIQRVSFNWKRHDEKMFVNFAYTPSNKTGWIPLLYSSARAFTYINSTTNTDTAIITYNSLDNISILCLFKRQSEKLHHKRKPFPKECLILHYMHQNVDLCVWDEKLLV